MILIVVFAGLYLIGMVGYAKLLRRLVNPILDEMGVPTDHWLVAPLVALVSVAWPPLLYWSLVSEAIKDRNATE